MGEGEDNAEFAAIAESSGLDLEQIDSLKKGFEGFDKEGGGNISQTSMQMILKSMGVKVDKDDMEGYCAEVDEEGSGKFSFAMFCSVAAKFMIEDDEVQMKEELKEAFRIYDKAEKGCVPRTVSGVINLDVVQLHFHQLSERDSQGT